MPVNPELLEILACPETKQSLSVASAEIIEKLNQQITGGSLRNRGGEKLTEPLAEGLVREDGLVFYPLSGGIPVMLIEESIELS